MSFIVYILYSPSQDRYYVGHTQNLDDRLSRHNQGRSKYTKSGAPWELKYREVYSCRSDAMFREQQIKSQKSRAYIERLIDPK
jgi:putative endonuclease